MHPKLAEALIKITSDILEMSPEEFLAKLDSDELGDVGQFVLDIDTFAEELRKMKPPGASENE